MKFLELKLLKVEGELEIQQYEKDKWHAATKQANTHSVGLINVHRQELEFLKDYSSQKDQKIEVLTEQNQEH